MRTVIIKIRFLLICFSLDRSISLASGLDFHLESYCSASLLLKPDETYFSIRTHYLDFTFLLQSILLYVVLLPIMLWVVFLNTK